MRIALLFLCVFVLNTADLLAPAYQTIVFPIDNLYWFMCNSFFVNDPIDDDKQNDYRSDNRSFRSHEDNSYYSFTGSLLLIAFCCCCFMVWYFWNSLESIRKSFLNLDKDFEIPGELTDDLDKDSEISTIANIADNDKIDSTIVNDNDDEKNLLNELINDNISSNSSIVSNRKTTTKKAKITSIKQLIEVLIYNLQIAERKEKLLLAHSSKLEVSNLELTDRLLLARQEMKLLEQKCSHLRQQLWKCFLCSRDKIELYSAKIGIVALECGHCYCASCCQQFQNCLSHSQYCQICRAKFVVQKIVHL